MNIFNRNWIACGLLVALMATTAAAADQKNETGNKPNILFLFADDWAWPHASCLGDAVIKTATADRNLEVIYKDIKTTPRMTYAAEQVRSACDEVSAGGALQISVQGLDGADKLKPEGFRLRSLDEGAVAVAGADQSGVLYGCLELAKRIRAAKAMPAKLDLTDAQKETNRQKSKVRVRIEHVFGYMSQSMKGFPLRYKEMP